MFFRILAFVLVASTYCIPSVAFAEKLTIIASIEPLGLLAKDVVGNKGSVDILLPVSASPHHYALKVSDRVKLLSTDLVLWVGEDLETMLHKSIKQRSGPVIEAGVLSDISWPESNGGGHHGHHHDHGGHDPHLWLDPLNNIVIADALAEVLGELSPENSSYFQANAAKVKQQLLDLHQRLSVATKPIQSQAFIVAHPAYDHFVSRYGLNQVDFLALTPERNAGAKHLYQLRQQSHIRCVFKDYGVEQPTASKLAADLSLPIAELDPLGALGPKSIVELIEAIGKSLVDCLLVTSSK